MTLVSAEPVVYEGTGAMAYKELLHDSALASLADRAGESPWQTAPPNALAQGLVAAAPQGDAPRVTQRLTLTPPDGAAVRVEQTAAALTQLEPSEWLCAEVWAKSSVRNGVGLVVQAGDGTAAVILGAGHSGSGDWERLSIQVPPPECNGRPLTLRMVARGAPAEVRDPALRVCPAPARAPEGNLLLNPSFELYTFTNPPPFPWTLDRWGGDGGAITLVQSDTAPEGGQYVALSRPKGGLRLNQEIRLPRPLREGDRIVVTAIILSAAKEEGVVGIRSLRGSEEVAALSARVGHPGGGKWTPVQAEMTYTGGAMPDRVLVEVFRRSFSDYDVLIDNVSARLIPAP